ncbi:hypothetical protein ACFL1I_07065 [Candidatus Omnitrophota bacterium]
MKYSVRKTWADSFNLLRTNPVVILPFLIIAFLEALALEIIYFAPRKPLAYLFSPVIRKMFGEPFNHYPSNFLAMPKLFYYAQVAIYILVGVLLTAISIGMVKNVRERLPLKAKALIKNALKRYLSLFTYGLVVIILVVILKRADGIVFTKAVKLLIKYLPQGFVKIIPFLSTVFIFLTNLLLQTFLILTVPIIVIRKKMFIKALGQSIILGLKNFRSVFSLIFLPLMIYLPVALLKTGAPKIMDQTFPEMNLFIEGFGIVLTVLVECFIVVCAANFLLDKEKS